jgi:hypothetical protein
LVLGPRAIRAIGEIVAAERGTTAASAIEPGESGDDDSPIAGMGSAPLSGEAEATYWPHDRVYQSAFTQFL